LRTYDIAYPALQLDALLHTLESTEPAGLPAFLHAGAAWQTTIFQSSKRSSIQCSRFMHLLRAGGEQDGKKPAEPV